MNRFKIGLIVSVIIVLLVTTAYIIVITQDIPTTFFNWNPPQQENYIPIILSYPDAPYNIISGANVSNSLVCNVKFLLEFNGPLSENTPIEIINATCVNYTPDNITVTIAFQQAIAYSLKAEIGDNSTVLLGWGGTDALSFECTETNGNIFIVGTAPEFTQEIYFPVAGNFSPIIELIENGQILNPTVYTYNEINVNVISASEIQQETINKINLGLTMAIFAFSYIGGIAVIYELTKKDKEETQFPTIINIMPNSNNTAPTKKQAKTSKPNAEEPEPKQENNDNRISNNPNNEQASPE